MRVLIHPDYDQCSLWAANYIVYRIKAFRPTANKPFVLGLPTGSTPMGTYRELIRQYQAGKVSFKNVVTFNMDEYVGLPPEHPQSTSHKKSGSTPAFFQNTIPFRTAPVSSFHFRLRCGRRHFFSGHSRSGIARRRSLRRARRRSAFLCRTRARCSIRAA